MDKQELRGLIRDTLYDGKCGARSAPLADTLMAIPLIAAAPALYEALKAIVRLGTIAVETSAGVNQIRANYDIGEVDRLARKALSQAEGKV